MKCELIISKELGAKKICNTSQPLTSWTNKWMKIYCESSIVYSFIYEYNSKWLVVWDNTVLISFESQRMICCSHVDQKMVYWVMLDLFFLHWAGVYFYPLNPIRTTNQPKGRAKWFWKPVEAKLKLWWVLMWIVDNRNDLNFMQPLWNQYCLEVIFSRYPTMMSS